MFGFARNSFLALTLVFVHALCSSHTNALYSCSNPTVSASDWASLRKVLGAAGGGSVFLPGSDGYSWRVQDAWLESETRRPLAIAVPEAAAGVAAVVRFARVHQACVTVRSGGHSYLGNSYLTGFIGIDVSLMNRTSFDIPSKQMTLQPAVTLKQSVLIAQKYGVFGSWGDCGDVAMGGYLTGGGEGCATPLVGLAVDSVLSYTVVTADGAIVTANETENADLYWGLRGGHGPGSNFGIVVEATVQMHVPPAGGSLVSWSITAPPSDADSRAFVKHFFDVVLSKTWPDEIYTLLNVPAGPLSGISVTGYYFGVLPDAKQALQSLSSFPDTKTTYKSLPLWQSALELFEEWTVPHRQFLSHSAHAIALQHSTVDKILNLTSSAPASLVNGINGMYWTRTGGVTNKVPVDATPYAGRGYEATLEAVAVNNTASSSWTEEAKAFTSAVYTAAMPDMMAADPTGENRLQVYANYGDLSLSDPLDAYYRHNLPRLQRIKAKYDPDLFFTFPQHIPLPQGGPESNQRQAHKHHLLTAHEHSRKHRSRSQQE